MQDFNTALSTFLAGAQKIVDDHFATNFPSLTVPTLTADPGRRYVRIVKSQYGNDRSVHCFVDTTNGDVLKAAGWKVPAKHARGNIFNADNGLGCMGPYGAAYLR